MTATHQIRAKRFLGVLAKQGINLPKTARILDLGCGEGHLVLALQHNGYETHGCDITLSDCPSVQTLTAGNRVQLINLVPYSLPYPSQSFDLVISDQVFEHVQDYSAVLAEIGRVLKPDGATLHILPSRYRFLEPHVHVPGGTIYRPRWWLMLWASLGIRNKFQQNLDAKSVCQMNFDYLRSSTNYLPKRSLRHFFEEQFEDVQFSEADYLENSGTLGRLMSHLGPRARMLMGQIFSTLHTRVILASHPHRANR